MTSQPDILEQLLAWAFNAEVIRAMWLTGSRADPAGTPDELSDFDIGMYVRAVQPFVDDDGWVSRFGMPMVRWPEHPSPTFSEKWVTQLVQYDDGVRIDFQITDERPDLSEIVKNGYRVLVDKDGLFSSVPTERGPQYGITPPNETTFRARVNAFWWDIIYVPKALLRNEINFARYMLDHSIRFDMLQPLIEWYIGATSGWESNCGFRGRRFQHLLPKEVWADYLRTFAGAGIEENWDAVFATLEFVRRTATVIASKLSLAYPETTDSAVTRYIGKLHGRYSSGG
jgi:aminoglycoside 6-adenylyltransferase